MSQPTPYLTDDTRHDIRNTRSGEYLFIPTPMIRRGFQFILASLSARYDVGIVAYALMGNHIHVLVVDESDPDKPSDVPAFRSVLRSVFAQFIKWYWGRENGTIFCPDSIGQSVRVLDTESIERTIAYIETNPIAAGMEKSPELLDGAVSLREWLLEPITIERPDGFFQKRTWGDEAELRLVVPPEAKRAGHTPETFYKASKAVVEEMTDDVLTTRRRAGKRTRPLRVLERMKPRGGRGRSVADHTEAPFTCNDPLRLAIEFEKLRAFRREHAIALQKLRNGEEDVVFPPGTYKAARVYGVRVRRPPERGPSDVLD